MKLLKLLGIRTENQSVIETLRTHGYDVDSVTEGVRRLLETVNAQNEAVMSAQVALGASELALQRVSSGTAQQPDNPDDMVYSYFVSYDASYSIMPRFDQPPSPEEADDILRNQGTPQRVSAMTVVNIEGGIKNWQNVMGVTHFLVKTHFSKYANVSVTLRNIVQINSWPVKKEGVK